MDVARVTIEGWVSNVKVLGRIAFLEVIDDLNLKPITIVIKKDYGRGVWEKAKDIKIGSAIRVHGTEPSEVISKRGRELHATEIEVLSEPIELPPIDLTGKTPSNLDTFIDFRYLSLRLPRFRAIFIARSKMASYVREYFMKEGFLEIHTPKLVGAGAEGGATLFKVDYFGKTAYLSQSPQLYKQMMMCGVPRVFEITPYFRAEKFDTPRHLNESWGVDAEIGFIRDHNDVMDVLEGLIRHVVRRVHEEIGDILREQGFEPLGHLGEIPRLSYRDALKMLSERGHSIRYGEDMDTYAEKILGEIMRENGVDAYFITDYPWDAKPFYIMKGDDGIHSKSFDLDIQGTEVASGGQREHRYKVLVENIREKGLRLEEFSFYLQAFKYGMPPHGGFGLGFDRLLMKILGLSNIREVVLFPRDRRHLVP